MKNTIIFLLMFLHTNSSLYSQNIENLTADQKKEYNRKKVTVEKVSETSGNMGWYWGMFAKKVDTWRAFKGLANQIEAEEFFRITGYTEEANKVKKNLDEANGKITAGYLLYFGGLIGSLIPKETYHAETSYTYSYTTTTYPYATIGTLAWIGGLWIAYDGTLKKLKPIAPFQTALDIADEYNKGLVKEITQ
jgi:hypothetical protein